MFPARISRRDMQNAHSGLVSLWAVCSVFKVRVRNLKNLFTRNPSPNSTFTVCLTELFLFCVILKNLRAYPGAIRGTEEWNNTYKIRTTVERDINHIKDNLCLAGRRTQNEKTLHADLILAGITQLITVVLSDKINHYEFIRSLKPLIA